MSDSRSNKKTSGTKRKFEEDDTTSQSQDDVKQKEQTATPPSPKRPRTDPTLLSGPTMQDKVEELFKKLVDAQADFSEQQDKDRLENLCKAYKNYFGPTTEKNTYKILVLGGLNSLKRTKAKYYEEHLKTADDVYSAIEKKDKELEKLSDDLLTTLTDYERENNSAAKRPAQAIPEMRTGMALNEIRLHSDPKAMEQAQKNNTIFEYLHNEFVAAYEQKNYTAALPFIEELNQRLNNLPPTELWATDLLKEKCQINLISTLLLRINDKRLPLKDYETAFNYCQKASQALSKLADTNPQK